MDIRVRSTEACEPQPFLFWDSVWNFALGVADWALAGFAAPLNKGGLRAVAALETAIILALYTDKACPPDHPLAKYADGDPRGWWGDGVDVRADLGEGPLGSLFWLLERAAITDGMVQWAQSLARDALAPILAQGAAARADVTAERIATGEGIAVQIALYGRNGVKIYDRKFQVVWARAGLA